MMYKDEIIKDMQFFLQYSLQVPKVISSDKGKKRADNAHVMVGKRFLLVCDKAITNCFSIADVKTIAKDETEITATKLVTIEFHHTTVTMEFATHAHAKDFVLHVIDSYQCDISQRFGLLKILALII